MKSFDSDGMNVIMIGSEDAMDVRNYAIAVTRREINQWRDKRNAEFALSALRDAEQSQLNLWTGYRGSDLVAVATTTDDRYTEVTYIVSRKSGYDFGKTLLDVIKSDHFCLIARTVRMRSFFARQGFKMQNVATEEGYRWVWQQSAEVSRLDAAELLARLLGTDDARWETSKLCGFDADYLEYLYEHIAVKGS